MLSQETAEKVAEIKREFRAARGEESRVATIDDIVDRWGEDVLAPEQPESDTQIRLADGSVLDYLGGTILE
jgi:hypothetical protein